MESQNAINSTLGYKLAIVKTILKLILALTPAEIYWYLDWKRSSGWLESREALWLGGDASTTRAEAIPRAKRQFSQPKIQKPWRAIWLIKLVNTWRDWLRRRVRRLCKQMGCKMNRKQCVAASCWVMVYTVQEEVDNDLGQFVLS